MKIQEPKSRFSIKWIKNKGYVYTWHYIKKSERNDERNRFKWIYIGPLTGEGGEYIKSFSVEEELKVSKEEIYEKCKLGQFKIRRNELSSTPTFYKRRKEIERLANRELAFKLMEQLQQDIEKDANEFVELMFQKFTMESFYDFLQNAGSLTELYETTKKSIH